jgi:hypothetical protein
VLGKIKVKLESLLVGQVLKDETGAVWDDGLDSEEAHDQVEEAGARQEALLLAISSVT